MEENSLDIVQSFIDPKPRHPQFDFALTTHLTKSTNFRPHNYGSYFFNFFLGFIFSAYETRSIRDGLGFERSYFKIMPENCGIKFVFFLKSKVHDQRRMHVRNVYFTDSVRSWERGLTSEEYAALKHKLAILGGRQIEEYVKNLEEYQVKDIKIYKEYNPTLTRRKMPIMIQKLRTDHRMIRTDPPVTASVTVENFIALRSLITDEIIFGPTSRNNDAITLSGMDRLLNAMRTGGSNSNFPNFHRLAAVIVRLYRSSKTEMNIGYAPWNGADCGFFHGSLTAWNTKIDFIPTVIHNVAEPIPEKQLSAGLFGRFYMSLQRKNGLITPVLENNIGTHADYVNSFVPIALSFTQDLFGNPETTNALVREWDLMDQLSTRDYWTDQKILMQVNLLMNDLKAHKSVATNSQKRVNFVTTLADYFDEIVLQKKADAIETLHRYLERQSNVIRPVGKTYPTDETNYMSRYFLGMLSSANRGKNKELVVSIVSGDKSSAEPDEMPLRKSSEITFLITSKDDDRVKIVLTIKETPLLPGRKDFSKRTDKLLKQILGRRISDSEISIGDTLVLKIYESYQHQRGNFADKNSFVEDYINREITVNYAKYDDVIKKESAKITPIETFNLEQSLLTNAIVDMDYDSFNEDVNYLFGDNAPYIKEKSYFKAFVDGLFHNVYHLRNVIPMRALHSTNQFAIGYVDRDGAKKISIVNFLFNINEHSDETRSRVTMSELRKRGRSLKSKVFNIVFNAKTGSTLIANTNLLRSGSPECSNRKKRDANCQVIDLEEKVSSIKDMSVYENIPQMRQLLDKMNSISNKVIAGFMIRDFISDLIRGDSTAALQDGSFAVGTVVSGYVSQAALQYGETMLESGRLVSGMSFKFASILFPRIPAAFFVSHLVKSVQSYKSNKNDTNALVDIGVDSAFIGIDLTTVGIEILEAYGLIEGVSSVAGPLGTIAGAVLIIGANIYQTVKRMEMLNSKIEMSIGEEIEETFRAFFHIDVNKNILKAINQHEANGYLMSKVAYYLERHTAVQYYFSESSTIEDGKLKTQEDNIIDLRSKSYFVPSLKNPVQAPGTELYCQIAEMQFGHQNEVTHQKAFWTKVSSFFTDLAWDAKTLIDLSRKDIKTVFYDLKHVKESDVVHGYVCQQSFGVVKSNISDKHSKLAFFQLGSGFDRVYAFPNVSNIFNISDGHKVIHGGKQGDRFILNGDAIGGILDGSGGYNILDLSAFHSGHPLAIEEHTAKYVANGKNLTLVFADIGEIIGREQQIETIECSNKVKTVNLKGGIDQYLVDKIFIPSCENASAYNMSVIISSYTQIENYGCGNFIYVVKPNISFVTLNSYKALNQTMIFHDDLINFKNISLKHKPTDAGQHYFKLTLTSISGNSIDISFNPDAQHFELVFYDGVHLTLRAGQLVALLKSNLNSQEIIEKYDEFLRLMGISMVAYSIPDSKSITMNHGKYIFKDGSNHYVSINVIHNDPTHDSLVVCSPGKNILIVKLGNNSTYSIPAITVGFKRNTGGESLQLLLDLSPISNDLSDKLPSSELFIRPMSSNNDIILSLEMYEVQTESLEKVIGEIKLLNVLEANLYRYIQVVNYNVQLVIRMKDSDENDEYVYNIKNKTVGYRKGGYSSFSGHLVYYSYVHDVQETMDQSYQFGNTISPIANLYLQPTELKFGSDSNLIYLTTYDIERDQTISISKDIKNYYLFRINDTLVITNINEKLIWDTTNLFTIIFENFYVQPKFRTIRIIFPNNNVEGNNTTTTIHLDQIGDQYPGIDHLWDILVMNDEYFYNFPHF